MTDKTLVPVGLGCPFCGRKPHSGPTKAERDQLRGEPLQRFAFWCPAGHARIIERDRDSALAAWNTSFNRGSESPSLSNSCNKCTSSDASASVGVKDLWALCYLHDWDPPREGQVHRWEPGKNVFPAVHAFYHTWQEAEAVRRDMTDKDKYWVVRAKPETEARLERIRPALSTVEAPQPQAGEAEPVAKRLKRRIDYRLNDALIEMKPDYDDSITGFNEAWDIVSRILNEEIGIAAPVPPQAVPVEVRNEEFGFVEFINQDVPYIVREIDGRAAILLDMDTRAVIGYRVYDPAKAADGHLAKLLADLEATFNDPRWHGEFRRGLAYALTACRPVFGSAERELAEARTALERAPSAAYAEPHYLGPAGMEPGPDGLIHPGSPYDRGRYDARKAVEAVIAGLTRSEAPK